MRQWIVLLTACLMVCSSSVVMADAAADTQQQLQALQQRVAELESQLNGQEFKQRNAELLKEMIADMDTSSFRQSADSVLTAGYDKSFFIKSNDDQFLLKFDNRIQARHTYLSTDDGNRELDKEGMPGDLDSDSSAFEFERIFLTFSGHVMKDIKFSINLKMGSDQSNVGLESAYFAYSFMPEFGLKFGAFKPSFNRQWNTSSGAQMFADRSLVNNTFTPGYGQGIEAFGAIPVADSKLYYQAGIFNSYNESDGPFKDDNNPSVAARLCLPLLGATPADFKSESDLKGHENPVAQIGTSIVYKNAKTEDNVTGGADDDDRILAKGADMKGRTTQALMDGEQTMISLDVAYKHQGLSLMGEGFYQHTCLGSSGSLNSQFGAARAGIIGDEVENLGFNTQCGYFVVPGKFELISRVGGICVDNANDSYEYAGGWNYYFSGHDLKLTMDVTYIDDLPITSSSANYYGIQNNALFMVRTQIQFQF